KMKLTVVGRTRPSPRRTTSPGFPSTGPLDRERQPPRVTGPEPRRSGSPGGRESAPEGAAQIRHGIVQGGVVSLRDFFVKCFAPPAGTGGPCHRRRHLAKWTPQPAAVAAGKAGRENYAMFDIASIQQAIQGLGVQGWLLYDFRGLNVLARRI